MEAWHPRATIVRPLSVAGNSYDDSYPWRFVVHTIEGKSYAPSRDSYYGHQSWPHFTITTEGLWQHLPIDRAAYALYDYSTTALVTNRAKAIQAEVGWYAADIENAPQVLLDRLADVIRWSSEQTGFELKFADFVAYPASYGEFASQRFSAAAWRACNFIVGHQHAPDGNDHGDPGLLPVARLGLTGELTMGQIDDLLKEIEWIKSHVYPLEFLFGPLASGDWEDGAANAAQLLMNAAHYAQIAASQKPGVGSSPSVAEIRSIVRDELAKLRLGSVQP